MLKGKAGTPMRIQKHSYGDVDIQLLKAYPELEEKLKKEVVKHRPQKTNAI